MKNNLNEKVPSNIFNRLNSDAVKRQDLKKSLQKLQYQKNQKNMD